MPLAPAATEVPWDVVVVGAGAAGMMAAFEARQRGLRVLLIESGENPGRKILISGGGRCNFTNTGTRAENFLSENPHFARSALAGFTPAEMVALITRHGIRFHEKTLGQLFCDGSARQVVTMLERECDEAGVQLRCGVRLFGVLRSGASPGAQSAFTLSTSAGELRARSVIVATGGLSIPKLGVSGVGYEVAASFGLRVVPTRPALVPLVFAEADRGWSELSGVAFEVVASIEPAAAAKARRGGLPAFRERLLITHRGMSGPAVLQVSSYWRAGMTGSFDLAPGRDVFGQVAARVAGRDEAALAGAVRSLWPARFAERWLQTRTERGFTNAALSRLEAEVHAWRVRPAGDEGFAKAEVTAGGVATDELDARTCEARRVPGLHFIGEVVDVTGWLGGYNFQWAWASAVAAGRHCCGG